MYCIEPEESTCADPGIFVRGGPDNVIFFFFFFFSPQLTLQKSNGQFQRNIHVEKS